MQGQQTKQKKKEKRKDKVGIVQTFSSVQRYWNSQENLHQTYHFHLCGFRNYYFDQLKEVMIDWQESKYNKFSNLSIVSLCLTSVIFFSETKISPAYIKFRYIIYHLCISKPSKILDVLIKIGRCINENPYIVYIQKWHKLYHQPHIGKYTCPRVGMCVCTCVCTSLFIIH